SLRSDVDGASVVRSLGSLHDARVFAELASDLFDDRASGGTHGTDSQRAEEKDQHQPKESANKDLYLGQVNGETLDLGAGLDFVEIRREQEEGGQRGGADGVSLGERFGGVADAVEHVGDVADLGRCL